MRGSSPLTRGKQVDVTLEERRPRLIPAHAGKTCRPLIPVSGPGAHPRSRGENWPRGLAPPGYWGLIPAHAGKTTADDALTAQPAGSSPLTRGKLEVIGELAKGGRLIPAHAGKTKACSAGAGLSAAHPRSRGENRSLLTPLISPSGSSPLTRGKHVMQDEELTGWRLIPAHAGKTNCLRGRSVRSPAHPRSRGENAGTSMEDMGAIGSSPLTRGKRFRGSESFSGVRLIPAHAGKTRTDPPS